MKTYGERSVGNICGDRRPGSFYGLLIFTVLFIPLTGCSLLTPRVPEGEERKYQSDDIEGYAEYVFRRQNQVSSRITLMLIDYGDEENYQVLMNAEEKIIDACSPLNHIAVMMSEDREVGLRVKYDAFNSLDECDHTTRDVEQLLQNISGQVL